MSNYPAGADAEFQALLVSLAEAEDVEDAYTEQVRTRRKHWLANEEDPEAYRDYREAKDQLRAAEQRTRQVLGKLSLCNGFQRRG